MKREQTVRRRLQSQTALHEAVSAMKSLSAHHFRVTRRSLPAAREYRAKMEETLAAIGLSLPFRGDGPPALLLVGADLGLCDGYNVRLVEEALRQHAEHRFGTVFCIGRRALGPLERGGVAVANRYSSPTSVAGLTALLLKLAEDVLGDYGAGRFSSLSVVSARFDGVGAFTPVGVRILPIMPVQKTAPVRPTGYVTRDHLVAVALREFLYITLYEILLDSLAAEHSTRLVATESAEEWLTSRIDESRRQLSAIRREAATQELLDIVSGARRAKRRD